MSSGTSFGEKLRRLLPPWWKGRARVGLDGSRQGLADRLRPCPHQGVPLTFSPERGPARVVDQAVAGRSAPAAESGASRSAAQPAQFFIGDVRSGQAADVRSTSAAESGACRLAAPAPPQVVVKQELACSWCNCSMEQKSAIVCALGCGLEVHVECLPQLGWLRVGAIHICPLCIPPPPAVSAQGAVTGPSHENLLLPASPPLGTDTGPAVVQPPATKAEDATRALPAGAPRSAAPPERGVESSCGGWRR